METYLELIKIILACLLWFASSSLGNVLRKLVLTDFPLPVTVTMVHLFSSSLYLEPVFYFVGIQKTGNISKLYFMKFIIPLALGKFLASVSSQISLLKVPVSYAHTVKATLPLFVVILSRIILKEKQTLPVYLSLLPIIGGVLIASATELGFDMIGLITALLATLGFSLQNIFSKKCLEDTGYHHLHLLALLSRIAALSFLPVWILVDIRRLFFRFDEMVDSERKTRIFVLIFFDGLFICCRMCSPSLYFQW